MIPITPGSKHEIQNFGVTDLHRKQLLLELERALTSTSFRGIVIHNRTKTALVTYAVSDGKLHISVTNEEQDEQFKL
jgi:hypothetical protein